MSSPTFLQTVFSSLQNNPALVEFAAQADEKALAIFKAHFTFSAHEITKAYQESFGKALEIISDELAQKLTIANSQRSRFTDLFGETIKTANDGVQSFSVVEPLKDFAKHKDKLFQLEKISETELMALVNYQSTLALTELLLEQMQHFAPLDDKLAAFFRHDDLLGKTTLFFLHEQLCTEDRVGKTHAALQREAILFNQQVMLELMEPLQLSSQLKIRDEFTPHDTETLQRIQNSVNHLKHLPTQVPEYNQLALMVGSATSSTGDLAQAEELFSQVIENTQDEAEKALAYFNRFQIQLRCQAYDNALADLQTAIDIEPQRYALHDVKTYPMEQLLGAGRIGCVFLCRNQNPSIEKQRVVVKCFWEPIKGSPEDVFKEAMAIHQIASDYVPEPLDAGYADVLKQERAYFVSEYIDGALDGEAWVEKYGPMDSETGLQVALQIAKCMQLVHDADIYHSDLKPTNVLLKRTKSGVAVKIIDFGLSQIVPILEH